MRKFEKIVRLLALIWMPITAYRILPSLSVLDLLPVACVFLIAMVSILDDLLEGAWS